MKANNAFRNYIEYIQFPYFRNLKKDTRIDFNFPLTVFVGQNGSGKSSTLHALFGAPKRNTPFEFWFSTAVDPIIEVSEGGDRHCFFYMYKDLHGNEYQVLKLRIKKRGNPDYWETSRPLIKYGMEILAEGARNEPIEKNVVYIDFRSELSAFDKYFYFKNPTRTKHIKTRQDFLRKHSVFLKMIIDGIERIITRYNDVKNKPLRILSNQELTHISNILGKNYISGKVIKHKFFEEWGYSVIFETNTYSYSEAFAGSGEMAIVRLVLEVLDAENGSLVLLDEPEVSLHPGAQKRLKYFLLEQIRAKHFQVIISTHSPSLIEQLPANAIKVFSQIPSGKFLVSNENTAEEAFYHLEQTNPLKRTIIVEDCLAKDLVTAVLNDLGPATAALFEVIFHPGGASVLKKIFVPIYSTENPWTKFIIFDGDQKPNNPHFNPTSILAIEQTNDRYKKEIQDQTGCLVPVYPDGNPDSGHREDQEKGLREKYLKYYLQNVFYLPLQKPEDIIWNQDLSHNLLISVNKDELEQQLSDEMLSSKIKLRLMSENGFSQKIFLDHWLQGKNSNYSAIVEIINTIKN